MLNCVSLRQVAAIALAYEYGRKDQQRGKPTQWIEVTMWGKTAEALSIPDKGKVFIEAKDVAHSRRTIKTTDARLSIALICWIKFRNDGPATKPSTSSNNSQHNSRATVA